MLETDRFPVKSRSRDSAKSYHYISSSCARTQCDASSGAFISCDPSPIMNLPILNAPPANARDRLIDTAISLFNRHGFHATGVDRIVAVAKVAKKTLYAHFPSKEDLILAALSRKRAAFADKFLPQVLAA